MDPTSTSHHTNNDYLIGNNFIPASAASTAIASYPRTNSSSAPTTTTTNSTSHSSESPSCSLLNAATSTTKLLSDVDRLMSGGTRRNRRIAQSAGAALYPASSGGLGLGDNDNDDDDDDFDTLQGVIIDDVHSTDPPPEPTSAMLHFCKHRFLRPFVQLLGCCGLRPQSAEAGEWSFWSGHGQTLVVLSALLFGYALQFVASFRRDRGIWRGPQPPASWSLTTADNRSDVWRANATPLALHLGETLFVYAVPGALHAVGFAWALYVLRVADNEHLQNLVERVFIQCADRRPVAMRRVAALWAYVAAGLLWLAAMTGAIVWPELMMAPDVQEGADGGAGFRRQRLLLRWLGSASEDALVAVRWSLLVAVFVHDFVQVVVITTYSIQCHLLRCHLETLREKLLQNTMDPMDWMREMGEFRKLLHHLNKRIAAPVCWFTLMNLIYTLAALIYAIARYGAWAQADQSQPAPALGALLTNAGNVALWLALALAPFFQAAALTQRCQAAQSCGHQVRVRPFGHQNSSAENLNSVLLYASSLRMSAKLFRMPIQGNYVSFVILCLVVGVLTTGMCLNGTPGFGGR